jgi:very-short-patch-repair endonuclease
MRGPIQRTLRSRQLRANQTDAETKLWNRIHSESVRDEVRDRYLRSQGYRVMPFWNNDVLSNIEGVLTVIDEELREVSASKSG